MAKLRFVDCDGTLIHHIKGTPIVDPKGDPIIGEVIPLMKARVIKWLEKGDTIVLFTARLYNDIGGKQKKALEEMSIKEFGIKLEVTNIKRPGVHKFYDDRNVLVLENLGILSK